MIVRIVKSLFLQVWFEYDYDKNENYDCGEKCENEKYRPAEGAVEGRAQPWRSALAGGGASNS